MPGGSVNGRPFRDDPTSYTATGIPRGNPKRYESRGIIRTTRDTAPFKDQRLPDGSIETEGDQQIQALVQQQTTTDVTIKGQLDRRRAFTTGSLFEPLTGKVSGVLSLDSYKGLSERDARQDELQLYGLSQDEVRMKLAEEEEKPVKKKGRIEINPSVHQEKLQVINEQIKEKKVELSKPDTFTGARYISRHQLDLERSLTHDPEKAKVMKCLVTTEKPEPVGDPKHPMNQVQMILQDLMTKRKKKAKQKRKEKQSGTCSEDETCPGCETLPLCKDCVERRRKEEESAPIPVTFVSDEDVMDNRLSPQEVMELPRFKNYSQGEPHMVLYVKNLGPKVTEAHLRMLFERFNTKDKPKVKLRLMTGRMRGQAFITFCDTDTAGQALRLLHGYRLLGRPMVIQYSKQS